MALWMQGRRWVIVLTAFGLVLAACGSTTSPHAATTHQHSAARQPSTSTTTPTRSGREPTAVPTSASQAGCTLGTLTATMSGRLAKSCYRIPNLPSGTYYLGIEAVPMPRGAAAEKGGFTVPSGHSEPAVDLTVSPPSAKPGETVTVSGRVSTPLSPEPGHANLCFDGCVDGLHYDGVPVHWLSSTEFQTSFVTPGGPWLERYPLRVVSPRAGSYRVGIQCLKILQACGLGHAEGSTTLTFAHSVKTVLPQIVLPADKVLPGEMIPVKGTSVLTTIIGNNQPFVDQFDIVDRLPSKTLGAGVYELPRTRSGTGTALLLSPVKLRVITPLTYQSISLKGPTAIQTSADPPIVTERGTNGVALTCSYNPQSQANAIRMLSNGKVSTVDTKGVAVLLENKGVPTSVASNESCAGLAALRTSSGKTVIAASYAINIPSQSPTFSYLPVISTNEGTTWTIIPSPVGISDTSFAGLRATQSGIRAYFSVPHHGVIAERTLNGTTWQQGGLRCPRSGPCVRFSPIANLTNCAMNGSQEAILASGDQGKSFKEPGWPSVVNACGPNELFSVHGAEYLLDDSSYYPLRRSTDGGTNWQVVSSVPTPPGVTSPGTSPLEQTSWGATALILPGSGDLLSLGQGTKSALLAPHAHQWCTIPTSIIPKNVGGAITGKHSLYFVTYSSSETSTFKDIPLTALRCSS
ncbi:MAG: hypothetical protein ACP5HZ_04130 [Ferrimicrobium sp.]